MPADPGRTSRAFTLVELVVTLALLGALASVALPRFIDLANEANRGTVEATAQQMRSAVTLVRAKAAVSELGDGCRDGDASLEDFSYGGDTGNICLMGKGAQREKKGVKSVLVRRRVRPYSAKRPVPGAVTQR